ncbi:ribosomal protein [Tanacetum coccineum]
MPQKKSYKAKRTGKCHVCGDTGHYTRDCKERKSGSEKVVLQDTTGKCHDTTRKCHLCGYTGHYARDCKERKSDSKNVGLQDTTKKCNAREYKYKKSDTVKVRNHELILENNDHVDVAGIGTVVLRFTTGKVLILSNVLHIPRISNCLVSVSKLDVLGYIISLGGGACVIKKRDEVIGEGIDDGSSHHGDILSTRYRLSLLEEHPVKKVVLDETIGLLESNEHQKLTKTRARGWYLLTRCTVHVCNSRDMFVDYQPVTGHEVVLENNSPVDVAGFKTVKLQFTSGRVLTLENVFHMPKIIKCCISVSKLIKMGFIVGFWCEGCDIKKDHDIVGNGYVENGLYRLSVVDEHPSVYYDPMIDNEVNLDNDDHAHDQANDSGFSMTCGG